MQKVTRNTNEARLKFRTILDDAIRGIITVIERYGVPVAVVVPFERWQDYEQWQAMQAQGGASEPTSKPS